MNKKAKTYSVIQPATMISLMGAERWKKIMSYIREKYSKRKVLLGYHRQGAGAFVYLEPTGKCIGSVADVEAKANKKRRKK